jgi:hypothetical protein
MKDKKQVLNLISAEGGSLMTCHGYVCFRNVCNRMGPVLGLLQPVTHQARSSCTFSHSGFSIFHLWDHSSIVIQWRLKTENWMKNHPCCSGTAYEVGSTMGATYIRPSTMENALSGFKNVSFFHAFHTFSKLNIFYLF